MRLEREAEALSVSIEPGMPDGHQITFFEEVGGGRGYPPGCSTSQRLPCLSRPVDACCL